MGVLRALTLGMVMVTHELHQKLYGISNIILYIWWFFFLHTYKKYIFYTLYDPNFCIDIFFFLFLYT